MSSTYSYHDDGIESGCDDGVHRSVAAAGVEPAAEQQEDDTQLEQQEELHSDTSFVPAADYPENRIVQEQEQHQGVGAAAAAHHGSTADLAGIAYEQQQFNSTSPAPTAAAATSKPSYSELQLRCQMLEAALEQQQQSSTAALSATLAAHAAEEVSTTMAKDNCTSLKAWVALSGYCLGL